MTTNLTTEQQFCLDHIQQAENTGSTLVDYAAQHNVPIKKLYDWRSRLRKQGIIAIALLVSPVIKPKPAFAKVITVAQAAPVQPMQIRLANIALCFDHVPDVQWLANLVRALNART